MKSDTQADTDRAMTRRGAIRMALYTPPIAFISHYFATLFYPLDDEPIRFRDGVASDGPVDATTGGNRDGYSPPEGLDIHRFEPADDRVPFGSEISLEAKLENTTDEPLTFQPPLFIYDREHELVVDKPLIHFELSPGEVYHQEVVISRATQEGELWIGWDEDGMRQSIGHITVYHPTETEVDREREP